MRAHGAEAALETAQRLRERLAVREPVAAIVLGSGLGDLASRVERAVRVPYADAPGFPASGVAGHAGELVHGALAGREVLVFAGRFHMYEGHSARVAAYPVRVARALGARVLLVTNAAGGVRRGLQPGDLMVVKDHLNLMFRNPLIGPLEPGDVRFPDMSAPYARRLIALLHESAGASGVPVADGVYCGLLGPSYETPAEVRMLRMLGADAVGMSTVPETVVAAAIGMEVAGVSLIANGAAGTSEAPVGHSEVVQVGRSAAARVERLVSEFVRRL